ncbi:MAG TPA: methyltransferase domain-containing protein [Candidatus Dormibacteraeota bacterium]
MNACQQWRDALRAWEIPPRILAQAPESPWFVPDSVLRGAAGGPTVSHRRALDALPDGGSVLDVGAGTGAMSRPLRSRARHITVVDTVAERLAACDADARTVGIWPDVARSTEPADVVVCGHVLYNVADLAPFVDALNAATRRRAVIELTARHPRDVEEERALWRRFWGIDRPRGPTWENAADALRERGVEPVAEQWRTPRRGAFDSLDDLVAATRRRLCLADDRDEELRAALEGVAVRHEGGWVLGDPESRLVTLWWDAPQP